MAAQQLQSVMRFEAQLPEPERCRCRCIAAGTPYMDVCDDQHHSTLTKQLHGEAQAAGVPCITTAGIYPGISNVMAAHMCSLARKEYNTEDLSYREPAPGAHAVSAVI